MRIIPVIGGNYLNFVRGSGEAAGQALGKQGQGPGHRIMHEPMGERPGQPLWLGQSLGQVYSQQGPALNQVREQGQPMGGQPMGQRPGQPMGLGQQLGPVRGEHTAQGLAPQLGQEPGQPTGPGLGQPMAHGTGQPMGLGQQLRPVRGEHPAQGLAPQLGRGPGQPMMGQGFGERL